MKYNMTGTICTELSKKNCYLAEVKMGRQGNEILVAFRSRPSNVTVNDRVGQIKSRVLLHVFLFIRPQNLHFHSNIFVETVLSDRCKPEQLLFL